MPAKLVTPGRLLFLLAGLALAAVAAHFGGSAEAERPDWPALAPGDPVPWLTAEQLASFERGAALFSRVFTAEEGLGPIFEASACSACHTDPVPGGVADDESMYVLRASRWSEAEGCDLLLDEGGDFVRRRAIPALQAHGIHGDRIPERATHVTRYAMRPLFGLGLVEAIPDSAILARHDPDDADRNGIAGRAPLDANGRVARFARKGLGTTLAELVEASVRLDLGLTTPAHPDELGPNRGALPAGVDAVANPELSDAQLQAWTDYIRFLAPPAPATPSDEAEQQLVAAGRRLFDEIGCALCHVPYLETGPSEIAALDRQRVYLYSDLLLHDLGEELTGTCGPVATPTETRTELLWGLRHRSVYMHDGRANTLWDAIELHGGTGAGSRQLFRDLGEVDRHALIRFLETL
jgi:CxxC motif-containing protein (DUF1111 family)